MTIQTLNFADLELQEIKEPIWVLNTSASSRVRKAAEVHIPIPKLNGSGQPDYLKLSLTWLPICITESIPRNQLMQASELRKAYNDGLINFITADSAAEINKQDGADEERERLIEERRIVEEAATARSITESGAEIIAIDSMTQKPKELAAAQVDPDAVDASFTMFTNALKEKSDVEAMNEVRRRGSMARKEVMHLIKNISASDKPKLVTFLSKLL